MITGMDRVQMNQTIAKLEFENSQLSEALQQRKADRESSDYMNRIINAIGDPIFVKDRMHRIVLANDALCVLAGKAREQIVGKSGYKSISKDQVLHFWEQEEEVFNAGQESVTEDNLTDGSGKIRTISTRKTLFEDQYGCKQIVGVMRDVTDHKRLESQYLQAQKMEAIGSLAGGIAHDLNNMLNVVNGYSELVLDEIGGDNPLRGDLELIQEAGKRAASLTSQLLAFARKQIRQPEILDLNGEITQMESFLRRIIREDIDLAVIAGPHLGLINADPGQIQQIIMNLAVNARDAMPTGGKLIIETSSVEFDARYVEKHLATVEGRYVMLAISDTGIGMDEEVRARVFEPFFTTKEKGKGTGLGLATVYGIVKQNGGFIWVYSEPGNGTTFKIYFPLARAKAARAIAVERDECSLGGSETVLVVEDEDAVRGLACRILRSLGYHVLESSDGKGALRIVGEYEGTIHLIVTDMIMPGMSGKELVSKIGETRPGVKSLFISGYTDNSVVHQGILDPKIAFLQKPFTVKAFALKVREVIDSPAVPISQKPAFEQSPEEAQ